MWNVHLAWYRFSLIFCTSKRPSRRPISPSPVPSAAPPSPPFSRRPRRLGGLVQVQASTSAPLPLQRCLALTPSYVRVWAAQATGAARRRRSGQAGMALSCGCAAGGEGETRAGGDTGYADQSRRWCPDARATRWRRRATRYGRLRQRTEAGGERRRPHAGGERAEACAGGDSLAMTDADPSSNVPRRLAASGGGRSRTRAATASRQRMPTPAVATGGHGWRYRRW
ncbi:hypothetical protein U9M48_028621 [Paspalum notatum var. saurae]|uniref:Uncharacterized protein n=1 Tax=Paspalum notatum var. saurae TaxID=547442 RepID=A0AAQ3X0T0_PASNO